MSRVMIFIYGIVSYAVFLLAFVYAIGFTGNFIVPKSIDSGNFGGQWWIALLINALLLGLFAIQHTIMARPAFKEAWTKIIPKPAERSTFVLVTSLILLLMYWQWRPLSAEVWSVENQVGAAILWGVFAFGWLMVLVSTFLIDHFELFGLKQVFLNLRGAEPKSPEFTTKMLYSKIRHPIMTGFIIAFWATPHMTWGHLFFAVMTTGYILIGITFEERDLIRHLGQKYIDYKKRVPALIPIPKRKSRQAEVAPPATEES